MSAVEPTPFARLVLAPNPGPMTLEGTNTWVLGDPGARVVVDPGPPDPAHLDAVLAHGEVALVVLTHGHLDHAESVPAFHALAGRPPVLAADPAWCRGADPLVDGAELAVGTLRLRVVASPGHSADSVCFVASAGGSTAVLTGDTVLGRGTTVLEHPGGRLEDYLASLHRLGALGPLTVLPGHGPVRPDLAAAAAAYLAHRAQRLDQVRAAVAAGADGVDEVVDAVYADVLRPGEDGTAPSEADVAVLRAAAARSVAAQLEYLRGTDPTPA